MNNRFARTLVALCTTGTLLAGCGGEPDAPPGSAPSPYLSWSSAPPSAPAPSTPGTPAGPSAEPAPAPLRPGDTGPAVRSLQQRLTDLGYFVGPVDGVFGSLTRQAVHAVQKAAGITRDGVVGADTRAALLRGVRPAARTTAGHVIEVDLDRQLLLVVDGGRVDRIINTSTGTFEYYWSGGERLLADTPRGTWSVYRHVDGWDSGPLGRLYRPKYFNRQGIAVHGYPNVPPYPASHGCVRVSLPAMDWMWRSGQIPIGTTVRVY